jgi:hypothetical protein
MWERDQRVASEQYLQRYIHMTIPETDVSDASVRSVIEELPRMDAAEAKARLARILTQQNAQTLVVKLLRLAKTLDEPSAVALVHTVALLSDQLPWAEGLSSLWSAAEKGPVLIRDLLARIRDLSLRKKVALEALGESASLCFAGRVLDQRVSSNSIRNLFDEEFIKDLADVVLKRIRDMVDKEKPIYVENPEDAQYLLLFWDSFGPKNEAKSYVTETVQTDPTNAMSLIHAFYSPLQFFETGRVFSGGLDAGSFECLSCVIDVSVMRSALEQVFGETLPADDYAFIPGSIDDRQLVTQFVYFCDHPPKKQSDATAPPPGNG